MIKPALNFKISAIFGLLFLLIAIIFRQQLTALMSLHMLVQIPLLVFAGIFIEQAYFTWRAQPLTQTNTWSYNEYGMPGLIFVSFIGAYWMVPKALDDALVDLPTAAFKYIGLPICGWILRRSIRRANVVIKVFFLGNFCWMSAIVGIVYLDQPMRLCNAYLQSDQDWAGRGLIALSIILPLSWLLAEIKPIWRFLNK